MVQGQTNVSRRVSALVAATVLTMPQAACGRAPAQPTAPTTGRPSVATTTETASGPGSTGEFVVPDIVTMRLSDAERALRARGFAALSIVDATGQGRVVLERDNWLVRSQDPPGATRTAPSTVITLRVAKPTDERPTIAVTKGVVPDVVCANLQSAQEALRAAGFFTLVSVDGTGQGRVAVLDRNWIVVAQSTAPGASPKPTDAIELTVVKYGEPTGDSGCRS